MLYLTEVVRNLEEEYHVQFRGGCGYGLHIISCQTVSGKVPEAQFPACLYIASGERPPGLVPGTPCLITSFQGETETENMFYCQEKLDTEKVYQSVQRMLYFRIKLLEDKEKLLKAVQNGSGEEVMIKGAFRHLGNPVYLCNLGLRILYQYPDDVDSSMIGDENGERYIINLESVKDDRLIQRILDSKIPFIQISPHFEYRMLIAPIRIRDVAMGFVFVKETQKKFSEEDIDYLSIFADVSAIELQKKLELTVPMTQQQEAFLEDLLSEKITDEKILRQRLELMNFSFGQYMWFGQISLDQKLKPVHIRTYVDGLRRVLPRCIIICREHSIIILAGCGRRDHFKKEKFTEQLDRFLNDHHLVLAASYGFTGFRHAGAYFRQTSYLLEEESRKERYIPVLYPDMDLAALTFRELRGHGQIISCIHPDLKTLEEYDSTYHTEYTATLKAYLDCGRNAKKAAEFLNIHKSTFHFRITKIGEVVDFQLTDTRKLFYYELGFALRETLDH